MPLAAVLHVVPVHSALQDEGFLKFVMSIRKGPLFAELSPDRFDSRGGTGTQDSQQMDQVARRD
jgi:hypothetical protein